MKSVLTEKMEHALVDKVSGSSTFGCFEVTIGRLGKERVDYLTYDSSSNWTCYEIKSSKEDFYSGHAITFVGTYNCYVMPRELYCEVQHEIEDWVGILLWDNNDLHWHKLPFQRELAVPEKDLFYSMIRSQAREVDKLYHYGDQDRIRVLEKQLAAANRRADQAERTLKNATSCEGCIHYYEKRLCPECKTCLRGYNAVDNYKSQG